MTHTSWHNNSVVFVVQWRRSVSASHFGRRVSLLAEPTGCCNIPWPDFGCHLPSQKVSHSAKCSLLTLDARGAVSRDDWKMVLMSVNASSRFPFLEMSAGHNGGEQNLLNFCTCKLLAVWKILLMCAQVSMELRTQNTANELIPAVVWKIDGAQWWQQVIQ